MAKPWIPRSTANFQNNEPVMFISDWVDAQSWCNFVLMKPEELPAGLKVERQELRPEVPRDPKSYDREALATHGQRSSYRCVYSGNGRRIRMRQFLYDWDPPAYDHPSLWLSERIAPFEVDENIGWLGDNYRKEPAACVTVDRTTIEISALAGDFRADEFKQMCRSLEPVWPSARNQILATRFGALTFQSRTPALRFTETPTGYWKHYRSPVRQEVCRGEDVREDWPGSDMAPAAEYGYELDTVFVFDDLGKPREVEYLYESTAVPGRYLRILATSSADLDCIPYPPVMDQHFGSTRQFKVGMSTIYHAFQDPRYGQHEAVLEHEYSRLVVIAKPGPLTDIEWFEHLVRSLCQ